MVFCQVYQSEAEKIISLTFWLLVMSYLYYNTDYEGSSNLRYDNNSKQLIDMINNNKRSHERSTYFYVTKDFDGMTGFDLFDRLKDDHKLKVKRAAQKVINKGMYCA